jgi:hypothetical protein
MKLEEYLKTIPKLPGNIWTKIFSYCEVKDTYSIVRVCRMWYRIENIKLKLLKYRPVKNKIIPKRNILSIRMPKDSIIYDTWGFIPEKFY